jgi:hypothetical protein
VKRKVESFNDDGNLEQVIDFKLIQQMFIPINAQWQDIIKENKKEVKKEVKKEIEINLGEEC